MHGFRMATPMALACGMLVAACGSSTPLLTPPAGAGGGATSHAAANTPLPGLQPSQPGFGECPERVQSDAYVAAQFNLENAQCGSVIGDLASGADAAKGNPYSADGYLCVAAKLPIPANDGNFTGNTYWTYDCTSSSSQIAFAFGVSSQP